MEHLAWSSLVSLGVGAGQACWGVPAADQPQCADHACKKGMVQGRLWVEGLFASMLAACVQPSPQLYPACGYVAASSCIVIRCGEAIEKPAPPLQGRLWVEGCVNSCATVYETPSLHTMDVVSALMTYGKSES